MKSYKFVMICVKFKVRSKNFFFFNYSIQNFLFIGFIGSVFSPNCLYIFPFLHFIRQNYFNILRIVGAFLISNLNCLHKPFKLKHIHCSIKYLYEIVFSGCLFGRTSNSWTGFPKFCQSHGHFFVFFSF